MSNKHKEIIQYCSAIFMLLFGSAMCIASFVVSVNGEVDDSVLWILGQCLVYSGSIFGIGLYVNYRIDKKVKSINQDESK